MESPFGASGRGPLFCFFENFSRSRSATRTSICQQGRGAIHHSLRPLWAILSLYISLLYIDIYTYRLFLSILIHLYSIFISISYAYICINPFHAIVVFFLISDIYDTNPALKSIPIYPVGGQVYRSWHPCIHVLWIENEYLYRNSVYYSCNSWYLWVEHQLFMGKMNIGVDII